MFTREALPFIGQLLTTYTGQDFTLDAVEPSKASLFLAWSTRCRDCGAPMTCTTPVSFPLKALRSRCEPCLLADYGCVGAERAKEAQRRYGLAQTASHVEARNVRNGVTPLRVKYLSGVELTADGLRCVFGFNDRKKRTATYRRGEVRCYEAKGCDFSPFLATLEKLHDQALAASLF